MVLGLRRKSHKSIFVVTELYIIYKTIVYYFRKVIAHKIHMTYIIEN